MPDLIIENRIRSGVDNFFRECIPTINRPIGETIEQMIALKHSLTELATVSPSNIIHRSKYEKFCRINTS